MSRRRMTLALVALALTAAACGGEGETNGGGADGGNRTADLVGGKAAEDAALALAKCMRANGVDMPDPGSGGFVVVGPDDADRPSREEMEKAEGACKKEREAMQGAIGTPPADLQDKMVEMARCMRGKGIDMPDPEMGEGGRAALTLDPDLVDDPDFQKAQEACRKEAGLPEPRR